MVEIIIQKKDVFLVAAVMIFLIGTGFVIAYNPSMTGGNI